MNEVDRARQAKNELNRAELANQVKENPIYKEAFTMFRAQLMEGFTNTKFKDSAERDEIWRKMQTIQYVQDYLEDVMDTGKLANHTLSMLDRAKQMIG